MIATVDGHAFPDAPTRMTSTWKRGTTYRVALADLTGTPDRP
jgi:hypothetical protein